ncbi:MAG: STAS domain-containing protein [Actinomycetota bacterium]|nr:STAS domain-containing protein [Actinomycetota bacterium]
MAQTSTLEVVQCGHHILELRGELCIASLRRITDALARIDGPVTMYVAGLRFMDSTGLRIIVKRLEVGPVTLLDVQPQVARLLQITGLDHADGLEIHVAT